MALRLVRLLSSLPAASSAPLSSLTASLGATFTHASADQPAMESCSTSVREGGHPHAISPVQLLGWTASNTALDIRRSFVTSSCSAHGGGDKPADAESISVTYVEKDGKEKTVRAHIGDNLLHVAHENEIDLEGACEGSLACSTCHVIVEDEEHFKKLPEASEDELDMLDLAYGLTETSRLGCQVIAAKELDGLRVRIPSASRNFYVDGHKPKPH